MATLTWIGGGNNSAGNPKDWSGDTTPKPGDTLNLINNATINVTGNQLHGDALVFTFLDGDDQTATINLTGITPMQVDSWYGDDITINLAANSIWIGGFTAMPGDLFNISGRGVWDNNITTYTDQNTNVGVDVIGAGTIEAHQAHSQGQLTFLHGVSVAATQTVKVDGYQTYLGSFTDAADPGVSFGGGEFGDVEIQSPSLYHAMTDIGFGQIILDGLKATSYSLKNDLLTLFNGKSVVDTLRLDVNNSANAQPITFVVSKVAAGIGIFTDGHSGIEHGTALAVHT
jgi:hypothetical protein